jgi:putative transposase
VYIKDMPAKNALKIYSDNSYYHIYNRGVNRASIFLDDQDYKTFLSFLKIYLSFPLQGESLKIAPSRKLKNYFGQVKLLAYCLMPNHFHLLINQNDSKSINFFMRSLATKYVRYFNKRHRRIGPVFQGVYKAVLVETERQFLYLTKYIHRNPLDILPTRRVLEGYKYSSYPNYLQKFSQSWVDTEDILSYFSKTNAGQSYQNFVEETDESDLLPIKDLALDLDF